MVGSYQEKCTIVKKNKGRGHLIAKGADRHLPGNMLHQFQYLRSLQNHVHANRWDHHEHHHRIAVSSLPLFTTRHVLCFELWSQQRTLSSFTFVGVLGLLPYLGRNCLCQRLHPLPWARSIRSCPVACLTPSVREASFWVVLSPG